MLHFKNNYNLRPISAIDRTSLTINILLVLYGFASNKRLCNHAPPTEIFVGGRASNKSPP